ncbi:glycosyltransferase [Roseiarcaceae bacterium H3SJ34-1]|uniref:glycosyltransferase n=1 Tax=Terripilifer ovatus TaxID=3032367 RepID=UPI003AB97C87|nr:glycosyltransferase [Roseiarcaceae bacterium H3SJ34-1]
MSQNVSESIATSTLSSSNGGRLLISEEALVDEIGHWYEYCRSVSDIHAKLGIECLVATHSDAKEIVRAGLKTFPVYRQTSWAGLNTEPNMLKRYLGILTHNALVYKTMDRLVRKTGPVDIVFAPTVTIHHLIGWRLFATRHGGRDFKRLVLLFRNNIGYYSKDSDTPKFRRATRILAPIFKSFSPLIKKGTVVFSTDSERLADEYEALCGLRPIVFPSPRIAEPAEGVPGEAARKSPAEKSTAGIVFSCLGPARFEKGIDILQEAIKLVLARRTSRDICFVVQWNAEIKLASGEIYPPDPALVNDSRVRLLTKSLTSDEYNAEISETDCMVLPYRRDSYFARISGVAVEGVTAGKPIIYTLGTWCEGLVQTSGAGIGVPDGDTEKLAWAIEEMANNFPLYKAQAAAKAEDARQSNSAEAFVEKLWGPILSHA